jgi:hypothetical protein
VTSNYRGALPRKYTLLFQIIRPRGGDRGQSGRNLDAGHMGGIEAGIDSFFFTTAWWLGDGGQPEGQDRGQGTAELFKIVQYNSCRSRSTA